MDPEQTTKSHEEPTTVSELFADEPATAAHRVPVAQQLLLLGVVLLLLFGGVITPRIYAFFNQAKDTSPADVVTSRATTSVPTTSASSTAAWQNPFTNETITAKAGFVWDVQNQRVLFAKNADESLPLASVTKLMTALLADELLSATSTVHIGHDAVAQYGNSGLAPGETFDRQTLTDLTLMVSSNDGAFALATATGKLIDPAHPADAFVHAMNARARELGLTKTTYWNPTGLDITTEQPGSVGSARDMAMLMQYILLNHPGILTYTKQAKSKIYDNSGRYHDAVNTDSEVTKIPGLIGSKTGYTDLAGGNLVVAFDAGLNRPIIVAVLGSTEQDRFTDVMQLVKDAQKYVAHQN